MSKSALILAGVCIALGGTVAWILIIGNGMMTVRIPLAAAQQRVDAALPQTERGVHYAYALTRAMLDFERDGRVGVDCDFSVTVAGRIAAGRLVGRARPVYHDRGFYLEQLEVTRLDLSKLELASNDLDRVRGPEVGIKSAATELQDHKIVENAVTLLVGAFLSTKPMYQLDETTLRHRIARLMLREIRIEPDALVAILDPTSAW